MKPTHRRMAKYAIISTVIVGSLGLSAHGCNIQNQAELEIETHRRTAYATSDARTVIYDKRRVVNRELDSLFGVNALTDIVLGEVGSEEIELRKERREELKLQKSSLQLQLDELKGTGFDTYFDTIKPYEREKLRGFLMSFGGFLGAYSSFCAGLFSLQHSRKKDQPQKQRTLPFEDLEGNSSENSTNSAPPYRPE